MKRVLIIEPYFGGSHKQFLEGLQKYVPADYQLLSLPARKWKMRMQLSAPWFVEQIKAIPAVDRYFDSVLCSTFIDVAVLRALLLRIDGWNNKTKVLTYFHENQFAYPQRFGESDQYQFISINFNSALVADGIAFNSEYNRQSFLRGCSKSLQAISSEMKFPGLIKELSGKSCVLFPGVDFAAIDKINWKTTTDIPVIVWNHRWEHDKKPESFFLALQILERRGVDFRLIVLGQSYSDSPACFAEAEKTFQDKIIHFGFVPSYEQYIEMLSLGDIVVSTSLHEFYGISIIEAVRAGCVPVLPDRLSYPELFAKEFLYSDDALSERLEREITKKSRLTQETAKAMTNPFSWPSMQQCYSDWLTG